MTKKSKILLILSLLILALVLYLILTSESADKTANVPGEQTKEEKISQLEADYQAKAKEIFTTSENLFKDDSFTLDKVMDLKNKLLQLKVPAKFKDLHVNFILALAKMENYLSQKSQAEKTAGWQMINQLKADYGWLNN